jgi:small GTP-binding protein
MNEEKIKRKAIRLSIIGDSKTGKTSILNCFLGQKFTFDMISNIGIDKQEKIMKMNDGTEIKVIIWDTAGQERFHSVSSGTIKNSQGIIVAFALDDLSSFNNVITWLQDVREISTNIPIVLFGNKCDLVDNRKVEKEEAEEFANNNEVTYFETSAKENIKIKEGFDKIIEEAYKKAVYEESIKLQAKKADEAKKKKFC